MVTKRTTWRVKPLQQRRVSRARLAPTVVLTALLAACTGRIEGDPFNTDTGGGGGVTPPGKQTPNDNNNGGGSNPPKTEPPVTTLPEASACRTQSPGPRALRRLTAAEYSATLRDLFGDDAVPQTSVFSDPSVLGFKVDMRALVVQALGAQQLMDQSETIAKWAVTSRLDKLTSCTNNDANCRQQFIRQFGKRVHRAPLSDADVAAYEALFAGETSFNDGVEAVTAAMLQSPYFLYRRELGQQGGNGYELTSHELASALSYLLTGSMPDDELMAAADSGALSSPAELEKHAERLLQSPRGRQSVYTFMRDWLGFGKLDTIAKDETVFKLTDSLRKAMAEETKRVIEDAVFSQNGSFASLLTGSSTFLNRELASHYGVPDTGGFGDQLTPFTYNTGVRDSGLLAHGSLLTALATASESSPVQRGRMVRVRLLCQDIPPPPANVDTALKPAANANTTREHFAEHANNPVCASCHKLMDPIGFGFENYDAFGRRREQENGHPVDASGAIIGKDGSEVPFQGLPGLTQYLTTQAGDTVNECLVRYMSYFAFGSAGWEEDQCTYESISQQAKPDGFAIRSVVKAILKTDRFARRVAD